jgi:hypothetical protein
MATIVARCCGERQSQGFLRSLFVCPPGLADGQWWGQSILG